VLFAKGINSDFLSKKQINSQPLQLMVTANNIMQLFVHRRLTGKTVKEMPEKELIRLIEKDMYIYKDKSVINTC